MKTTPNSVRALRSVLISAACLTAYSLVAAPTLSLNAPSVLPRDMPLGAYSPHLHLNYADLPPGHFEIKLWLLESSTGNYYCGSTQWCERRFKLNNNASTNVSGNLSVTEDFDVFDYEHFLWVARVFNPNGTEVAATQLSAKALTTRPPVLKRIGRKSGSVGQELRFRLNAITPGDAKVKFTGTNLPEGSELDAITGDFKWTPSRLGTVTNLVFEANSEPSGLSDAETIEIEVKAAK